MWYVDWQEPAVADRLNDPGLDGVHELELTDRSLIERSSVGTTANRFESIHKIVERRDHYLIYLTPMLAHVVLKAAVSSGELDTFLGELSKCTGLALITTGAPTRFISLAPGSDEQQDASR